MKRQFGLSNTQVVGDVAGAKLLVAQQLYYLNAIAIRESLK